MTIEKMNKNYLLWCECLKKYNCFSELLITKYGEKIKDGTFSMNANTGSAYQGGLLDIVLNRLCVIASHINDLAFGVNKHETDNHPYLKVNKNSLMKVLLLQHISKAEMFVSSRENWKIQKGMLYEFNQDLVSPLKLGQRSVMMCMNCGITFTEEEYEAMLILDKEEDKQNIFMSPLSELVKISNELVSIESYRNEKFKNTVVVEK